MISLPYYLLIAEGKIIEFILFPWVFVLCESNQIRLGFELMSRCRFPTTISSIRWAPARDVLCIILSYIWWWSSRPGNLGSVEYIFISITPMSTLDRSGSTSQILLKLFTFCWNVGKNKYENIYTKILIQTCKEHESLTTTHDITLSELTC